MTACVVCACMQVWARVRWPRSSIVSQWRLRGWHRASLQASLASCSGSWWVGRGCFVLASAHVRLGRRCPIRLLDTAVGAGHTGRVTLHVLMPLRHAVLFYCCCCCFCVARARVFVYWLCNAPCRRLSPGVGRTAGSPHSRAAGATWLTSMTPARAATVHAHRRSVKPSTPSARYCLAQGRTQLPAAGDCRGGLFTPYSSSCSGQRYPHKQPAGSPAYV